MGPLSFFRRATVNIYLRSVTALASDVLTVTSVGLDVVGEIVGDVASSLKHWAEAA